MKKENRDKEEQKEDGNRVATVTIEDLVIVLDADLINIACDESSWVVDSGAASHVTSRKEFFSSYTQGDFGTLSMGNETVSRVAGVGTICLETSIGTKLVLNNVKHAPDVRLHLISVGVLDDEGYVSTNGAGKWKLTKGSMIVARGEKRRGLYWTTASTCVDMVNVVESNSSSTLWHKRLSHISEKGQNVLAKKVKF